MFESLVTILSSAAVSSALAVAIVWLFQNWISERLKNAIKHEYDAKLEIHKVQLKAAADVEIETYKAKLTVENAMAIERLKSDLQIAASERQVRFARLHEKVAEVVAEVYSRLFRFTTAVDKYVAELELAGAPSKKELRIAVGDAMTNFTDYYKPHALYLPKTLANQTKAYSDKLFNCARDFKLGVEEGGDARSPNTDTWRRVATEMRKEAPALFLAIEDEFRKMLGVHNL